MQQSLKVILQKIFYVFVFCIVTLTAFYLFDVA